MTKDQLEHLEKLVNGEISTDIDTLEAASMDASIFKVMPDVVIAPANVKDVENVVSFVKNERQDHSVEGTELSITARSAGTCMSGGPLSQSIVLDFLKFFRGIKELNERAETVTLLPGTYYRDLKARTEPLGLLLPCYTASWRLNTLGGMVGNNSGGEKTLTYGKTEDYILRQKVVLSDGKEHEILPLSEGALRDKMAENTFEGRLYKEIFELIDQNYDLLQEAKPQVSKNSAGYYLWNVWDKEKKIFDLNKLFVGAQGTLGITTEITFKLVRPKEHSTLLVVFMKDLRTLATIINKILKFKPESFESYDDNTLSIALRYLPAMVKMIGVTDVLKLGLSFLPELKMVLTGGMPKLVLVAEFTGDSEREIYEKAREAEKALSDIPVQTRVCKSDQEERKYWTIRRQSFDLLRKHVHGKHTAPFIDDICVRPEFLPSFLPKLEEVMHEYNIVYTIAGHVGDGNFHIIPLMNYKRPDFKEIITKLSEEVYDLVVEHEGSIDGEHNDGLIRTPFLDRMYSPEVIKLFARTKHIFDPLNIFNPGKKVGGSLEDNLKFVRPD